MINDLSDFLDYARDRLTNSNDPLPCEPEDCAAVIGYLCALVPEYQLDRQEQAQDGETRRADRRQAMLDGFRRARGGGNGNGATGRNGSAPDRPPGRSQAPADDDAPEAA